MVTRKPLEQGSKLETILLMVPQMIASSYQMPADSSTLGGSPKTFSVSYSKENKYK
jgi:hypothetical protein